MKSRWTPAVAALLVGAVLLAGGCRENPFCPVGQEPYVTITKPAAGGDVGSPTAGGQHQSGLPDF